MTPGQHTPDCIGRGNIIEKQLHGLILKIKQQGLLQQEPPPCSGRGIVICGGGKYARHAWVVAARCRGLGWTEGIQVWHLGPDEINETDRLLFQEIDTELVDAYEVRKRHPSRRLGGWECKTFAAMYCPWRHVMFLDADATPEMNPAEFFNHREVQRTGSIFFSDCFNNDPSDWMYIYAGLKKPAKEWESGFWIVDKVRVWMGLRWAFWLNEHSDIVYRLVHGDKSVLAIGMLLSGCPHLFSEDSRWEGYGIGQYYDGKRWVKHWMGSKRGEHPYPEEVQRLFEKHERRAQFYRSPASTLPQIDQFALLAG